MRISAEFVYKKKQKLDLTVRAQRPITRSQKPELIPLLTSSTKSGSPNLSNFSSNLHDSPQF